MPTKQGWPPAPKKTPLMTKAQVRGFIEALANHNPAPKTELTFADPFTLLVAVVLSAQATDLAVNKATSHLFRVAPTPKAMIDLGDDGVASHIRSSGCGEPRQERHGSGTRAGGAARRPGAGDRAALEALPGVGRKTANVVLNVAFGESTMAVDTHIFRVAIAPAWRQERRRGRWRMGCSSGSARTMLRCAPLADPARALCLQSTPAGMLALVATEWCRYGDKTAAAA